MVRNFYLTSASVLLYESLQLCLLSGRWAAYLFVFFFFYSRPTVPLSSNRSHQRFICRVTNCGYHITNNTVTVMILTTKVYQFKHMLGNCCDDSKHSHCHLVDAYVINGQNVYYFSSKIVFIMVWLKSTVGDRFSKGSKFFLFRADAFSEGRRKLIWHIYLS